MDAPSSKGGSPYITNFDLVPPSPPRSVHDDFAHPASAFHLPDFDLPAQQSPLFNNQPHTPSYNGSYYNSPFSQHSDLSFAPDELNFDLLPEMSYEPSDYDQPPADGAHNATSAGGLLMFAGDGVYDAPALGLALDPDPLLAHALASPPLGGGAGSGGTPAAVATPRPIARAGRPSTTTRRRATATRSARAGSIPRTRSRTRTPRTPAVGAAGATRAPRLWPRTPRPPGPTRRASTRNNNNNRGSRGNNRTRCSSSSTSPRRPRPSRPAPRRLPPRAHHSPQPQPSPRLSVAQQFGSMSVHTPSWGPAPLPSGSSPSLNNLNNNNIASQHHLQKRRAHRASCSRGPPIPSPFSLSRAT
ncbi:hypothetical protein BJ912DRAFT_979749, partial [Pholiota molesta]